MARYTKGGINDAISMFSYAPALRRPMYGLLDKLQEYPPHILVLSLASFLSLLTEELGTDMRDVFTQAERITGDMDSPFAVEIKALKDFINHEYFGVQI